ncbi:hypothetical protein [Cognatishimia maritima]|uniref:Excalibur calcium-binding domain-containing protein n=1 Tax=Cognatishimia maritima TaxID=870908 RepID=A0A1M5NCV6_9RHOB|nr:hypothetical protein [Cognatishimia maritima]SHG87019.1 hypothetical protein SAMN04488044_1487 [Cognatishimia maritima]
MTSRILPIICAIGLSLWVPLFPNASHAQSCHPSYQGACLPPNGPDVDCAGGSGNGPIYVQGPIRVVGPDPYGLDRDGDGRACEKK